MFKRNFSIIALVIAAIFSLLIFYMYWSFMNAEPGPYHETNRIFIKYKEGDTNFKGIFISPTPDASLPHYKYQVLADSIKKVQDSIDLIHKGTGTGRYLGSLGVIEIEKNPVISWNPFKKTDPQYLRIKDSINILTQKLDNKDTIVNKDSLKSLLADLSWRYDRRGTELLRKNIKNKERQYYFSLSGYELERIENHQTEFFILNDTYNLQYVVWDSAHKDGADSVKWGHWELRKIPVRYGSEKKAVLIPITKKRYEFIDSVLKWGSWILMFLFFYFFIGLPIQILVNISRGKAFISKNIRRLKLMALIMGIYALVNTAGPYILGFFYLNTIPKEFSLRPFWQVLIEGFYLFLISIGIYIIALAFQRGYKLQQENSLTI